MKGLIKRILSEKSLNKLKAYYEYANKMKSKLGIGLSKLFTMTKPTSAVFCLFNRALERESYSVLKGRQSFVDSANKNVSLYRRNVHRLEKAMIMRPLRSKFAEAYILELVQSHRMIRTMVSHEQYLWGQSVLEKYFELVTDETSDIINTARELFLNNAEMHISESKGISKTPFDYRNRAQVNISFDEFYELTKARKSVRWFKQEPIDIKLLHKAVNAATQAPSACNRQPFSFYFANDAKKAQHIASLAMGSAGFCSNIPSIIAVVGDLSYFDSAHDRHVIYIDSSLATMQMLLAFETLGLAGCILNWPDIKARDQALSNYLKLEPYQRVVCLIAVGYPDENGLIPFSEKKTSEELIKEV
ncbi:TPA: nitroreductase family protein [Vibrio vulnificus]